MTKNELKIRMVFELAIGNYSMTYNWGAIDENGEVYIYVRKPRLENIGESLLGKGKWVPYIEVNDDEIIRQKEYKMILNDVDIDFDWRTSLIYIGDITNNDF